MSALAGSAAAHRHDRPLLGRGLEVVIPSILVLIRPAPTSRIAAYEESLTRAVASTSAERRGG